jgi:hypothetical protein
VGKWKNSKPSDKPRLPPKGAKKTNFVCLEKKRVQRKNTFATNLPAHHMRGKQNEGQEAEGEGPGPLAPEAAQK